eukprot:TRINITY_DN4827_c1_g4_i1.p1 TRINITY_DN4827_c1_g4~~TRINITY_DN4827_c1_g4_i1.p1  ORF type:complete len:282 (+),score=51.74 TRINITY_DN4827_c1_g4_i1:60-848(+)
MGDCFSKRFPLKQDTLDIKTSALYVSETELKVLYREFVRFTLATDPLGIPEVLEDAELPKEDCTSDPKVWYGDEGDRGTKLLRLQQFLLMPWFNCNPFAPRVYEIFRDNEEGMSFDAFVTMASCLNQDAPPQIKSEVAYRLFDFDGSGNIREEDIRALLEVTTGLRDLWCLAAEATLFQDPVGPKVRPGWPKGSFPTPKFARPDITNEEIPNLREACNSMATRIFASVNVENKLELTAADFSKVLAKVPDMQKRYSVKFTDE